MKRITKLALCGVLAGSLLATTEAASIKVSPSGFIVHKVRPGKEYNVSEATGLKLTAYNDSEADQVVVLSVRSPSEKDRFEKGYLPVPDGKWCWFDKTELTIPPKSHGYANLFLHIPDEDKYYNQHWIAIINAVSVPPHAKGNPIGVAVDIRAQIETKDKADVKEPPNGISGIVPGTMWIDNVVPGSPQKSQFAVYNNDSKAHTYKIEPFFSDAKLSKTDYLSGEGEGIPDSKWISVQGEVQVPPNASVVVPIELTVPVSDANFGKVWEDLLLITPDEGRPVFVRAMMATTEKPKTN